MPTCEVEPEELDQCRNAAGDSRLGDIPRWIDAEHRDPVREKVLQQIAVVGGELDNEVVGRERETRDDHLDVPACVLDPRVGIRGEVRVLREDAVRRHKLRDLHQPAVGAYLRVEGIEDLRLAKSTVGQHRLAER